MNPLSSASRALKWLEAWSALRRLDRIPFRRALIFGVLLGLFVGLAILALPIMGRWFVAVAAVSVAAVVAWTAQPVGIWDPAEESEPFLDMVPIVGGTFWMGSPRDELDRRDDEKQHRVALSAFRMARTTVTKAQYREVMDQAAESVGEDHPVTEVSWFDAITFCNRLSEREGLTRCYAVEGETVTWIEDGEGYRLPTEAEWEYAARAGTTGRWSFGDDEYELGRYAWYSENSGLEAHEVATREPNPWGLYDVHGNVWEWCWDSYAEYGGSGWRREIRLLRPKDPRGPKSFGAPRVLRGGASNLEPRNLRSAVRYWLVPVVSAGAVGFRCVRRAGLQP